MKHVQFGAGNIGRSFIGQLFARAGYEVVFVDVDETLLDLLNRDRRYPVEIRDQIFETIWVEGVRAINGRDMDAVAEEMVTANSAATAVGPNALPYLYPVIAAGLLKRRERSNQPLDIILCENLRGAAEIVRQGLRKHLPRDFPLDECVGLVETSIGKMVPIMTSEQRRDNLLAVHAEAYNTLIVDKKAFRGAIPNVPQIDAKGNMAAYVDRKLFIHNLGHAVAAYVGFLADPSMNFIWEAVERSEVRAAAEGAMSESAQALLREYPEEFTEQSLREHIEDLLRRFGNKSLGDTIHRVGRDIPRKLAPDDRLIGALRLDLKHDVDAPNTVRGIAAALLFRAGDEAGHLFPADAEFLEKWLPRGCRRILTELCRLNADDSRQLAAIGQIVAEFDGINSQS